LETTDESVLSDELQVCYTGKYIFVSDMKTATFFRFNAEGKYLNKIGRKGQGPGEYTNALFFRADTNAEIIYIIDSYSKRLLSYTFDSRFIESIPVQTPTYMIDIADENFIYYDINYNRSGYELYLSDRKGKVLNRTNSHLMGKQTGLMLEQPFFYAYNQKRYYKNPFTDTVFHVDNQLKKIPVYVIDCGKKSGQGKENQYDLTKGKAVLPSLYVTGIDESGANMFITYVYDDIKGLAIYSKQAHQLAIPYAKNEYGLVDDLSGGPAYMPFHTLSPGTSIDNTLISVLYYHEIADTYKNSESIFSQSVRDLDEESNPIVRIVILKLK
jgi:hypothetical protein